MHTVCKIMLIRLLIKVHDNKTVCFKKAQSHHLSILFVPKTLKNTFNIPPQNGEKKKAKLNI